MKRPIHIAALIFCFSLALAGCAAAERFVALAQTNPDIPSTNQQVAAFCQARTLISYTQTVVFPEKTTGCPFGISDNLGSFDANGRISARSKEEVVLAIPETAVLCDMKVTSPVQEFRFDDEIYLLLNEVVMGASSEVEVKFLAMEDGLYLFNWARLVGQNYARTGAFYCLPGAVCEIPFTEQPGDIQIEISSSSLYSLSARVARDPVKKIQLVTTGDDNPSKDCKHKRMEINVKGHYAMP